MQPALLESPKPLHGFRDPAFTRNREIPLHRWIPWIAGFSAQFVEDCLEKHLNGRPAEDTWVLDPFSGVGTTLVEAYARGFNVVGFEINPYAVLASCVKLQAAQIPPAALAAQIAAFEKALHGCGGNFSPAKRNPLTKRPEGFSGRTSLFSPAVELKVLFALDFINSIQIPIIRDLFRLALGSVMVSFSNYSYEPSLTRRSAVDKPEITDADVAGVVAAKLRLMQRDIEQLRSDLRSSAHRAEIFGDSFFSALGKLKRTGFIDLVVTSPPYLNNYHYPRNTRPQIHWLGLGEGPGYKGAREEESFGKFWQTVRCAAPVPLAFGLPELEDILTAIRTRNVEKGNYGGPGWANYVATYFNDTLRFCKILSALLRPNAAAVIVLGNSIIQGIEVKTDYFFGKTAELCGLDFEDTLLLRQKRTGNSIIQSSVRVDKAAHKTALYESAVVLRKRGRRA